MRIAILGWGSLIWQPKELKYNQSFGWKTDGPFLPIEFARISKDGRLTLVITAKGTIVPTLYALSNYKTIDEAVLDLAIREGSGRKSIGVYDKAKDEFLPNNFKHTKEITEWIKNRDFDAVIWTNLSEKWEITNDKNEIREIDCSKRLDYLKELKGATSALAEQYIRKTPKQVITEYREKIEEELKWFPID